MATALATTAAPVQFDFQNNNVEVMTLDTLRRTHKENDIYGNPLKGIYHYEVIERMADICQKHNLHYEVEEIFAAQNKNKAQPVEAHILRRVYTTIRIKEWETDELTTTLVIAFHQDGIQAAIGPCVRVCHNQCILSPERSVSNYGKDKVTTEELFGRVDEWLSNFEVQMNEDRERIRRLKAKVITPVEMYAYIGLLTALRVSHDSSDKRLSSKVETYPLNQSQISIFTEDLLKLTEEKKTLTAWDIYNVATEIYKPGRTDIPAMIPQNGALAELMLSEGLPEKDGEYLWETYCWLSFCTACRASDVRTLRWKDILGKSTMTRIEQKTKKNRLIKFNRDVQEKNRFLYEMLGQPAPEQYIFLSPRTGKPYSLEYINRLLKVFKVRYRLPIRAFSTHTFRKTFGRYVYELMGRSAEGLILLNQIFRHSNLETTRRYIGLAQEDIDKVFDSIRL